MFDGSEYDNISYMEVESPRHLDAAEKAAEKSFVLLKNNGILPLDKEKLKTIGIIGPNADSRQALIGNYHGQLPGILPYRKASRIMWETM